MFGKKKEQPAPIVIENNKPAEEPVVPEIPAEPEKPVFVPAAKTTIGKGITMVGNFDTKDPVEINGIVRGNIRSTSSLEISENGSLYGEAALSSMTIRGRVDGSVLCSNSAEFTSTGSMKGNLSTGTLKTADGAVFEGKLNMLPKKPAPKAPEAPKVPETQEPIDIPQKQE